MKRRVRLLPEARAEFDDAGDYYEARRKGLGKDFVAKVRDVFRRISANPRMHGVVYHDVRMALVDRFPYVVLYREDGNEVIIVSVFHTSRDPSIWQSRV
ncbi:MAG: type II toxin-antitoxin system RelE/ParE family toxin [Gemmataceae bacterium]